MRIDLQTHYLPPSWLERGSKGQTFENRDGQWLRSTSPGIPPTPLPPGLLDIEINFAGMERAGIDLSTLSLFNTPFEQFDPEEAIELARDANDQIAAIARQHPTRLVGIGSLPMHLPEAAIRELERLAGELRLPAVQVFTNYAGVDLDDRKFWSIYERMAELGVAMILHPRDPVGMGNRFRDYGLTSQIGFMFDSTTAVARLIYSGMFDQFPTLPVVAPHLAGTLTFLIGRLDHLSQRTPGIPRMSRKPSDYLKSLYLDTACYSGPALKMALEVVGADHLVLGSDFPFWNASEAAALVENLPIGAAEKDKIFAANAQKLLKLAEPAVR